MTASSRLRIRRLLPQGERLASVSLEQVLQWSPEVILTQDVNFYQMVYNNPLWQAIPAVRDKKVLFVPNVPFGWLDVPPSINRLLGALWLSAWLHNEEQAVLIEKLRHFFILFLAFDPGVDRLQKLLANPAAFAA